MNQSHQNGPHASYYMGHETLQPVQVDCRDCGDTEVQFVPIAMVAERIKRQRCDECHEEVKATVKAQMRAALDHPVNVDEFKAMLDREATRDIARAFVAAATKTLERRPDEVEIVCDSCSDAAAVYEGRSTCIDGLEGKAHRCESCGEVGKIYMVEPDGGDCFDAFLRFRPYTQRELDGMEGL